MRYSGRIDREGDRRAAVRKRTPPAPVKADAVPQLTLACGVIILTLGGRRRRILWPWRNGGYPSIARGCITRPSENTSRSSSASGRYSGDGYIRTKIVFPPDSR